jgi:hypothetical protein
MILKRSLTRRLRNLKKNKTNRRKRSRTKKFRRKIFKRRLRNLKKNKSQTKTNRRKRRRTKKFRRKNKSQKTKRIRKLLLRRGGGMVLAQPPTLTPEQKLDARSQKLIDNVIKHEPAISQILKNICIKINTRVKKDTDVKKDIVWMEGWDFRIKKKDRIRDKIKRKGLDYEPRDTLRFTAIIDKDHYICEMINFFKELIKTGKISYDSRHIKHSWAPNAMYKGNNMSFRYSDSCYFELQFHTPGSYKTKQEDTHAAYQAMQENGCQKTPDPKEDKVCEKLREIIIGMMNNVSPPRGIEGQETANEVRCKDSKNIAFENQHSIAVSTTR